MILATVRVISVLSWNIIVAQIIFMLVEDSNDSEHGADSVRNLIGIDDTLQVGQDCVNQVAYADVELTMLLLLWLRISSLGFLWVT